jgi:light-regulated signal transduction histidine kinase (bacteriophytochrome)
MLRLGPIRVTGISAERAREIHDALLDTPGRIQLSEMSFTRRDGTRFPAEVARRAVRSGDRWVVISCIRDVTRRKKAEEELAHRVLELQRSNSELERFAYIASHDLTEPLRMVSSYVQLLRRRYDHLLDSDGRDFIQFATEGTERMKMLLDDLLIYSRAGRTLKPPAVVDLQVVMRDVARNLEVLINETGATVEIRDPGTILSDRTSLTQVLQNLVANGIKFALPGRPPVVRVGCSEDQFGWTVSVADNGIGIEDRYFERIFVVFQRLHARGEYAGTGIGLAVCKKIVERYGGRIWLESKPGEGTTFYFTLPRHPEVAPPA